jgi:choice-of-anchor A domain-containing protein
LIINVDGQSLSFGNLGWTFIPNGACQRTVWNFFNAETITLQNVNWFGSILAPFADIVNATGNIM